VEPERSHLVGAGREVGELFGVDVGPAGELRCGQLTGPDADAAALRQLQLEPLAQLEQIVLLRPTAGAGAGRSRC
jgi:hypothetical protein